MIKKLRLTLGALLMAFAPLFMSGFASAADTTPPSIDSFNVFPSSVDVRSAPAAVTITAKLSDPSGVADFYICLRSSECLGNHQTKSTNCAILTPQPQYVCSMVFVINQNTPNGDWDMHGYTEDALGNRVEITSDSLAAAGYTSTIHVTSNDNGDTTPPSLDLLTVLPDSVDVTNTPAAVAIKAKLSDPSGIVDFALCVNSPNGVGSYCLGNGLSQSSQCYIPIAEPYYVCLMVFTIDAHAKGGSWEITGHAQDVKGNRMDFNPTSLSSAGFTNSIQVASDN